MELYRGAEQQRVVRGEDGWLFLRKELRHVGVGRFWGQRAAEVSRAQNPEQADPLEAIVDYDAECEKWGLELIVLPIPPKALIYPEAVAPELIPAKWRADPRRLDPHHQRFYELLREKGVTVMDPTKVFLEKRYAESGRMYCKQDSHFSGRACVVAAERLAERIRGRSWYETRAEGAISAERQRVRINGDLRRALGDESLPKEILPLRKVRRHGLPIKPDRDSPVLLMGDSHTLVFHDGGDMHAKACGLADQLAYELEMGIDVLGVRGSGARPARIALYRRAREAGYLEKKELIIWCFSARELTEAGGWGSVPLKR